MENRKCKWCEEKDIISNKENTEGVVYFKKSYYHQECFKQFCASKMSAKKPTIDWSEILNNISQWQNDAKVMMREAVFKDELYEFLMRSYNLSCMSTRIYKHFSDIYKGEYKGLAYAIGPEELLSEWKFYLEQLRANRSYKSMSNDQALIYDMAVILGKNAEYRELMEKKKIEAQVKQAQKQAEPDIDLSAIQSTTASSRKSKRRAELYQEFMGGNA